MSSDDSFRIWLREVSIILNDAVGKSAGQFNNDTRLAFEEMFDDGYDPMDAAQEALNREHDWADLEELLAKRGKRG